MNYNHPNQVRSPQDYVKHIKPLYDGGEEGCSIAILEDCDGIKNIGIRWNVSEKEWNDIRKTKNGMICVGMPQSRGYSVWFLLPRSFWRFVPQIIKDEMAGCGKQNMIHITEKQIQDEIDKIFQEYELNR